METIRKAELPMIDDEKQQQQQQVCNFDGYDADTLMKQMAKFRKLITKRGSLEILIPLCCTTNPVRYLKFRNTLKGFSSDIKAKLLISSLISDTSYIIFFAPAELSCYIL